MIIKGDLLPRLVLFLDDGGVISDNSVRAPQWRRLVGEFFAPRLGGEPEAWAEANRVFTDGLFEPIAWELRLKRAHDYWDFERIYFQDWLEGMCKLVGVSTPPDSLALGLAASAWITQQVKSDFPGAAGAIRLLYKQGYVLYTASGESSTELKNYLDTMGVRDCFGRLYGPDLINTLKAGPQFYERLLADAGISPDEALVVDDSPAAISWASQVGARTILVGSAEPPQVADLVCTLRSLAELPSILKSI